MAKRERSAGDLRERVAFDAPIVSDDGYGGTENGWQEQYSCRAAFIYAGGSEAVVAARLQGRESYKVAIRSCAAARAIKTDWRMRNARDAAGVFAILSVDALADPAWVYLIVQTGVPA
ncbi:head-tail adaptor protein [Allorhizobium borbori]|uniref:Head-tail adaptor n=1 Tax=Allorhizobium borbori TaxID=485907 RepID=A0A7W6K0N4_9HYPH|nr:head-tail adaptor protein [Allorhizobium borbori]MBB4103019.1 head-tail adaptor [Allorhizobium borbori]